MFIFCMILRMLTMIDTVGINIMETVLRPMENGDSDKN